MAFFSTFDMDKLGTNRRHHWKKLLKISKIAKFESDLLKINEDIAPQFAKFYRRLYGGGQVSSTLHHTNFADLYLRSPKTYHFQIWQCY